MAEAAPPVLQANQQLHITAAAQQQGLWSTPVCADAASLLLLCVILSFYHALSLLLYLCPCFQACAGTARQVRCSARRWPYWACGADVRTGFWRRPSGRNRWV
jgi:hypothetical protein